MKTFTLAIFAFLFALFGNSAKAEIVVYKTYADFQSKTGEHYDSYFGWKHALNSISLIFKKNGENVSVKTANIWGFVDGNSIYRIDHVGPAEIPYLLVSTGKINYYENGIAHLKLRKNQTFGGECEVGLAWAFSIDLNSDVLVHSKKNEQALMEASPAYKEFFDCAGNTTMVTKAKFLKVRVCALKVNEED
jgi:hypothetical protein